MAQVNIEFAIYVMTWLLFIAALVLFLLHPLNWGGWLVGLAAGIIWLVVWYAPVSIWAGAVLVIFVLGAPLREFRPPSLPKSGILDLTRLN
jgi:hypothetical protein